MSDVERAEPREQAGAGPREQGAAPRAEGDARASGRRRARAVLRALTGLLVVALAGGTAWAVDLLPVAATAGTAEHGLTVVPSSVALVCPGPAQLADPDGLTDPAFDPSPVGTTTSFGGAVLAPASVGVSPVRLLGGEAAAGVAPAAGASLAVVRGRVPGPTTLTAAPAPDGAAALGAAVVSTTAAGDLRGLAGGACVAPTSEQWLLGGTTTRGASTRLVVQNPSRTAAVVDVTLWGPGGPVEASGPTTMTVPAGGQAARLLESVAPEQRLLGVRVVARGALVASYLQVGALDGLRPLGVDLAEASRPATRQVVAGVATAGAGAGVRLDVLVPDDAEPDGAAPDGAADDAASDSTSASDDDVPGTVPVAVTVLGSEGRVLTLDAVPGRVTSLDLGALDAGRYTVVVDAGVPLVASVAAARPGRDGDDVALVAGRPAPGTDESLVASPAGVRRTLTLAAVPDDLAAVPGAALGTGAPVDDDGRAVPLATRGVAVEVVGADGRTAASFALDVPVGGTTAVDLDARAPGVDVAAVVVRPTGEGPGVAWALGASADALDGTAGGLVTVLAPAARDDVAREVVVRASQGW